MWQRFGAAFGSDTNAQTTPISTVYKLDLPSATEATLDESIKILSGMMEQPVITDTTVTAERPVVLAEQREQPGPQVKFRDALNSLCSSQASRWRIARRSAASGRSRPRPAPA